MSTPVAESACLGGLRAAKVPKSEQPSRHLLRSLLHVRLSQYHEVFVRNTTAALITVHHFLSEAAERDAVFFLCADAEVAGQIIATLNIEDIPS